MPNLYNIIYVFIYQTETIRNTTRDIVHRKTIILAFATTTAVTTTSLASGRASADANTTATPFARSFRRPRPAAGWCTACRPAPERARPPVWATTARWPRPPRDGPRACPSPVAPVSSCTCGSGTRFSPADTITRL